MRLRPFLTLLVTATAATASSVRDEAVVNTVQPTAANPRSSSFTDSLNGSIDLSNEWTLNLGGSLTMQGRTPASQRGQFPESGSVVVTGKLTTDIQDSGASNNGTPLNVLKVAVTLNYTLAGRGLSVVMNTLRAPDQ